MIFISGCLENLPSNKYDVKIKDIITGRSDFSGQKYDIVNVIVKNNDKNHEFSFRIPIVGITYSDGTQMWDLASSNSDCIDTSVRSSIGFTLLPYSQKELSFCFSSINWEKKPQLYIKIVDYSTNNANEMLLQLSNVNITKIEPQPTPTPPINSKMVTVIDSSTQKKLTEIPIP